MDDIKPFNSGCASCGGQVQEPQSRLVRVPDLLISNPNEILDKKEDNAITE
jgi:hypothetical protein